MKKSTPRRGLPLLKVTLLVAGAATLAALLTLPGNPVQAAGTIDFESQIYPILERSCLDCHGPKDNFSNLRVDSVEALQKGGDLGAVLVPGEPDESPLYGRVSLPSDDLDFMPVEGDPLTEEESDLLKQWIEEGADFGSWTSAK